MDSCYPCGAIEEFVLSPNRRKLLQIENRTKDNDSKQTEQSSIIYGSDTHLYYHLLQIENEITAILMNNTNLHNLSQVDTNNIKSLLNEANELISKYKNKKKTKNANIMIFRHKLRTLFLSPYIEIHKQETKQETDDNPTDIFDI
eukprot:402513_1